MVGLAVQLMLKLCGISHSSPILWSDSLQSNNTQDLLIPLIPRKTNNVEHSIAGCFTTTTPNHANISACTADSACTDKEAEIASGYSTGNPPEDYGQTHGGVLYKSCGRQNRSL